MPLPNTDAEEQNNELQSKVLPPNPGPLLAIEAEQQRTKLHSRVPLSKERHLIQVEPARGGITEAFGVIKPAVDQKQQRVIIEVVVLLHSFTNEPGWSL
ncbi:unnamed protein product [Anisakis simplex]|uniref:Uncharacterized protein n=1 Tax=Anisakis simplex TaxID=6269 RepID=A0A0M3JNS7_ANISI|nr:unnamed protein product [Anisakis simplex]